MSEEMLWNVMIAISFVLIGLFIVLLIGLAQGLVRLIRKINVWLTKDRFLNWWNTPVHWKEPAIMANFTVTWWNETKLGWIWVKRLFWIGVVMGIIVYMILDK